MGGRRGDVRHHGNGLTHLLLKVALDAARAVATAVGALAAATTTGAGIVAGHRVTVPVVVAPATRPDGDGKSLDVAVGGPLARSLAGIHAVIGGKVPADHVGLHGGAFLRQLCGLVRHLGAVLSVVHANLAVVTRAGTVGLVCRF